MKNYFDRNMSVCIKGVGILLLLFHHLFYSTEVQKNIFHLFNTEYSPIYFLANQAKICVSLFLILSGYGMSESFKNKYSENVTIGKDIKFSVYHIFKIYLNFWFVYIVFWCIGRVIGKFSFCSIYNNNIKLFLKDFLGISGLSLNTVTINSTWWFMSTILLCYMLFCFFRRLISTHFLIAGALACLIYISTEMISKWPSKSAEFIILEWTLPFFIGMIYSRYNILNTLYMYSYDKIVDITILLIASISFRYFIGYKADILPATILIVLCAIIINKVQKVKRVLRTLGEFSMDIYLFHSFLYVTFFQEEIYSLYFPIIIYVVFILVCLVIAVVLSYLKKFLKIQCLVDKVGGVI